MLDKCSICLEDIGTTYKGVSLTCGHIYHSVCILEWYEVSNNGTCPYCRDQITIPGLFNFTVSFKNVIYKFNKYKRRSVNINGESITFINKLLLNENAIPYCWNINKGQSFCLHNTEFICPVYELLSMKISFYARLYILYSGKTTIILNKNNTLNNIELNDIDEPIIGNITKNGINILFDWVYEVIFELKQKLYNHIVYHSSMNTFIFDLFFVTVNHFKLEQNKNILQGIMTCSIYYAIKYIERTNIKFTEVLYYTDDAYTYDDISEYIDFQRNYIEDNVTFLNNYRFSGIY